jgi:hypothetical protein
MTAAGEEGRLKIASMERIADMERFRAICAEGLGVL